jgi:Rrf2 family protein
MVDKAMRVSTRGRYGLRAMFELARDYGESPVLLSTVAERQGLPHKYLHALLTTLKSAGLVRSVRGTRGGFLLARRPAEIRLSEIMRALEGPLSLVDCVADRRVCDREDRCPTRQVWQELSAAIEHMLDGVTLADLVSRQSRRRTLLRTVRRHPRSRKTTRKPRAHRSASATGRRKAVRK